MMHSTDDDAAPSGSVDQGRPLPPYLHDTHHLWLKAILLAVWVVFSFGVCFFARDLQALANGWQLGYWMVAQGAVLMFMAIVLVYCVAMDLFERRTATQQEAPCPSASDHARSPRP